MNFTFDFLSVSVSRVGFASRPSNFLQYAYTLRNFYKIMYHHIVRNQIDYIIISQTFHHQSFRNAWYPYGIRIMDKKKGSSRLCTISNVVKPVERAFTESISDSPIGIRINGIAINNIIQADDTVILADNANDLLTLLDQVNETTANNIERNNNW